MKAKQIHEERGQKTYALIFDTGDEFISELTGLAKENGLDAADFTALGASAAPLWATSTWRRRSTRRSR